MKGARNGCWKLTAVWVCSGWRLFRSDLPHHIIITKGHHDITRGHHDITKGHHDITKGHHDITITFFSVNLPCASDLPVNSKERVQGENWSFSVSPPLPLSGEDDEDDAHDDQHHPLHPPDQGEQPPSRPALLAASHQPGHPRPTPQVRHRHCSPPFDHQNHLGHHTLISTSTLQVATVCAWTSLNPASWNLETEVKS